MHHEPPVVDGDPSSMGARDETPARGVPFGFFFSVFSGENRHLQREVPAHFFENAKRPSFDRPPILTTSLAVL